MAQSIEYDRYPKFVADQVLTEKSLNQMFNYLEEQQRLTRTTLIGIGVMCGMEVSINEDGSALTISHGVGVTSKGYLVPFPETTYTFYNDEFSAAQELFYEPFYDSTTQTQKFPLSLLHNNGAADIAKPLNLSFLEDKAVVIFVELLKVDNQNCDPDSCDDKGCTIEVTHRPLLVALEHLHELQFNNGDDDPFLHEPSCIEWPQLKMPKYNVPATYLLSSPAVLRGFLDVMTSDFLLHIENVLTASYGSLGYYIQDEFPNNPFSGLRTNFSFLFNGSISSQQLLFVQYYYDFFSDLIMAYEELRQMCNDCLSLCCPNEALFPRHLILGNAVPGLEEFRHHWIQSPAFSCDCCSEGRIKFLLKKMVLLVQKLDISTNLLPTSVDRQPIRATPSNYGNIPLSQKAIPFYYDTVGAPNVLYDHWNYKKRQLGQGATNLSYHIEQYNGDDYYTNALKYDLEPNNFVRIEGHIGMNWKAALASIKRIKYENRLPIDVVALNGDIFALIQSLLTSANSLAEIISGNRDIGPEIRCYFADIESQYDAHAAELRCTLTKVMAYFYNLPIAGSDDELVQTANRPVSDLIRRGFPNYRTKTNTYGAQFDNDYPSRKNAPYLDFEGLMAFGNFLNPDGSVNQKALPLIPFSLMYYLEKTHEALPDGLVQLQVNTLAQRIEDAFKLASFTILGFDFAGIDLPASFEGTLNAVVRICKAEVFKVLYRNFLINYVLFIANQSFALYAIKNPGVQHKAGVTMGGTLVLVYNDKKEIRDTTRTIQGVVRAATGAPLDGVSVLEKGTTNGKSTKINGSYSIMVSNPAAKLVFFRAGYTTKEISTTGTTSIDVVLMRSEVGFDGFTAEPAAGAGPLHAFVTEEAFAPNPLHKYNVYGTNIETERPFMDLKAKKSSVRMEGLNEIYDIVDGAENNDFSDSDLRALVDEFAEGTVIADFFVPNMCRASCMPMNFIVMEDKEPDPGQIDVRLSMKQTKFCEDAPPYPINVFPEDGELTVDGLPNPDRLFDPSSVTVGDQMFKTVLVTFSAAGEVRNLQVQVYRKPEIAFEIDSINHTTRVVTFKNNTKYADRYAWLFSNGSASSDENPGTISFAGTQAASVTLEANNDRCSGTPDTKQIPFEDIPGEVRSCTSIEDLGIKFKELHEVSTDDFRDQIEGYDLLHKIFVEEFGTLLQNSQEDQCKLLLADLNIALVKKIFRQLDHIIQNKIEMRNTALALYEILWYLILFYSCCQEKDVNEAKNPTQATLLLIEGHLKSWVENGVDFSAEDKAIFSKIKDRLQVELDKTMIETPHKLIYIDILKSLLNILTFD